MRLLITSFIYLFLVGPFFTLQAQTIPKTSVYSFKMSQQGGTFHFTQPRHLTSFNPDGYNNQPNFVDNNTLYLTVQFPEDTQTDIYALNLSSKKIARVTRTIEGEYSPTLMPNGRSFSAIRVEADDAGTQRLWQFPKDRSTNGKPVFADITGVGYHQWLDLQKVALFIVGEPHKLVIANQQTGSAVELLDNIGRGFQKIGSEQLAFIHKVTEDTWYIKEMNSYTYRFKEIVETLPGSEDFIYLRDGTFLMGSGSKLYKFNRVFDKAWKEIADFKYYGITDITRLAISDNGTIAIVDKKK